MSGVTDKIKKEIRERNLSITDFSSKIGVSRETIYNLSDETIKYATVKKIAEVLKLPLSYFVNDDDEKKPTISKKNLKPNTLFELIERHRKLHNEISIVTSEIEKEAKKYKKQPK